MATLKDVAREAGVSVALVSYYLNGSKAGRMSDETRGRIAEAMKKLNYRPNRVAQSLSRDAEGISGCWSAILRIRTSDILRKRH